MNNPLKYAELNDFRKDYDDFMESYKKLHKCCPNCGEDSNFTTTLEGYVVNMSRLDEYKDENKCRCMSCGHVHIYHDRVPKKSDTAQ